MGNTKLDINQGGTNAETALGARINLGATGTGLYSGGTVTGVGGSTFSVASGVGIISDNSAAEISSTLITFSGGTGITPSYTRTIVAIDNTASVVQIDGSVDLTPLQRRTYIVLAVLAVVSGTILAIQNTPAVPSQAGQRIDDLGFAIGNINIDGNLISANGANLLINKSAGKTYRPSSNYENNKNIPDTTTDASATPISNSSVLIGYRSGVGSTFTYTSYTGITPNSFDDGDGTPGTVSNNKWTIQRIYFFPTTNTYVVYLGQTEYSSPDAAIAAIDTENRVIDVNTSLGSLRCNLIVKKGATALNDSNVAIFKEGPKIHGASSAGNISTSNLQGTYTNSVNPEIVTDSTRGALTIQEGTGTDTNNVIEGRNNAGSVTFSVNGNGLIVGNGIDLTNVVVSEQKDTSDSSTLTGNTNNTLMKSFLIPANTFTTNDWVQCGARFSKTNTNGQLTNRIYVNTSNSLSGATLLGTQTNGATALSVGMERNLGIKSASSTRTITTTTSFSSDFPGSFASASEVAINIDWTVAQYIIFASQLANVSDSVICTWGFIHKH